MNRRLSILIVLLLLVVAVVLAVRFWPAPARDIVVQVDAPRGARITGEYELDAVTAAIDTIAPVRLEFRGRRFECIVGKSERPGALTVRIEARGTASVSAERGERIACGYDGGERFLEGSQVWARLVPRERVDP
jgi:hypothetical protein